MTDLLGRPIVGEITHYGNGPTEQKPIADFLEALDTLLGYPEVEAVRWEQYTPYFNDGDACEFDANAATIRTVDSDGEYLTASGSFPAGYYDTHAHARAVYDANGLRVRESGPFSRPVWEVPDGKLPVDYKDQKLFVNGVAREDIQHALRAFSDALECGQYNVDLRKHFGDPAQITATREGFTVEGYDHE